MQLHKSYGINGQPILGTYVAQDIEAMKAVHDVGMNMIIGGKTDLDSTTETGRFCKEHGIGIQYHMTHHLYGKPRLREFIDDRQTVIPVRMAGNAKMRHVPDTGTVQIEDELITYRERDDHELRGCVRGANGTKPASHREGIILFWPDECRREVEEVKYLPNLCGYYVLDDSPGDANSALRAMYSVIREVDSDVVNRPVVAGFGSLGSLVNFSPGVCDIVMFYWYPVSDMGYDRLMTSTHTQWALTHMRKQVPGIPFLGVYQAFDGGSVGSGQGKPTKKQLREQLEDFVREGASGLVAFLCSHKNMDGFAENEYMKEVIGEVHREILETGGCTVAPEPEEMRRARIQPQGFWEVPPNEVPGIVPAWNVIGPFDAAGKNIDVHVPPDDVINLDATYDGKHGRIRWITRRTFGGVLGISELHGAHTETIDSVTYAQCRVTSPEEQRVQIRYCSDDDAILRLNGKTIHRFDGGRGVTFDADVFEVVLPKGESTIDVKVHNRAGMHGLFLRFTDLTGAPLSGLTFSPDGAAKA